MRLGLAVLLFTLSSNAAWADVKLNEIYYSPEDPDQGRQFIELRSTTGGVESLANLWVLEIDGDAGNVPMLTDNPGTVLTALNLNGFSTGANGLFMWRDSDVVLDNSPALDVQGPGQTTVHVLDMFPGRIDLGYEGEDNEFENDVVNFLLVEGFTGSVGMDLDTEANAIKGDGAFNLTPWTRVLDAVSVRETVDPGFLYGSTVGGANVTLQTFGPDILSRDPVENMWAFYDSGSGEGQPENVGPFFANDGGGFIGSSDAAFADGRVIHVGPSSKFLYATPGAENRSGVGGLHRGDTDHDGDVDAVDIDVLFDNWNVGGTDYDVALNAGLANQTDVDALVKTVLQTDFGDANLDQDVDGSDFLAWQQGVGTNAGWGRGDFDSSTMQNPSTGRIDAADLAKWRGAFGFGAAAIAGGTGVPEPSSLALAAAITPLIVIRGAARPSRTPLSSNPRARRRRLDFSKTCSAN